MRYPMLNGNTALYDKTLDDFGKTLVTLGDHQEAKDADFAYAEKETGHG